MLVARGFFMVAILGAVHLLSTYQNEEKTPKMMHGSNFFREKMLTLYFFCYFCNL